ncbi:MAG: hypothetical protein AAB217_21235 [Chloroflexota bacterium]
MNNCFDGALLVTPWLTFRPVFISRLCPPTQHDGARSAEGLRRMPIGGTATGTGSNVHLKYHNRMVKRLGELIGLTLYASDNLFEGIQSQADAADFSASLRTTND